jgi:5-methylthioribose kinase|tara:strand:- start:361 stop:603 length:243 start_codon:yes stop_codon:yes gene_type:complete
MDEQIIKILEKKIGEIKNEDNKTNQIIDQFSNFDSISFSSGMMIGRLFNSFYYQHRRILKRSPTDVEFNEFLEFLKNKLG